MRSIKKIVSLFTAVFAAAALLAACSSAPPADGSGEKTPPEETAGAPVCPAYCAARRAQAERALALERCRAACAAP